MRAIVRVCRPLPTRAVSVSSVPAAAPRRPPRQEIFPVQMAEVEEGLLRVAVRPESYLEELTAKVAAARARFDLAGLSELPEPVVFESARQHFRQHAEFGVWHNGPKTSYVMFAHKGKPVELTAFPMGSERMGELMPQLLAAVMLPDSALRRGLFAVKIATTLSGEALATFIYKRPLDDAWRAEAEALYPRLGLVGLIGRSRNVRLVLGRDEMQEQLRCGERVLTLEQREGLFCQSNGRVAQEMLTWAAAAAAAASAGARRDDDLLELYCGSGPFTVALAPYFRRVVATEISKVAMEVCGRNLERNRCGNVQLGRVSAEELREAMEGERLFERLRGVDLPSLRLSTVLVDPPRAGLGADVCALCAKFPRIVYISCNTETMAEDLVRLGATHRVERMAFFDQFAYTPHLEAGAFLVARDAAMQNYAPTAVVAAAPAEAAE